MAAEHRLDGEAARRLRAEFLADALPVRFAGPVTVVTHGIGDSYAVVQLEASDRPDVADLVRVHHAEGLEQGRRPPFRYLFVDGHGYMEFALEITDPVTCRFTFVLEWPEHAAVFTAMLERGILVVTTARPEDAGTDGIGMTINQPELRHVLGIWQEFGDA
jgi:hypothetical protein